MIVDKDSKPKDLRAALACNPPLKGERTSSGRISTSLEWWISDPKWRKTGPITEKATFTHPRVICERWSRDGVGVVARLLDAD